MDMNAAQIAGVAIDTIETIAPVILQILAATNPGVAAALPAVEAGLVALRALESTGVFTQDQVATHVQTIATGVVALHNAAVAAAQQAPAPAPAPSVVPVAPAA